MAAAVAVRVLARAVRARQRRKRAWEPRPHRLLLGRDALLAAEPRSRVEGGRLARAVAEAPSARGGGPGSTPHIFAAPALRWACDSSLMRSSRQGTAPWLPPGPAVRSGRRSSPALPPWPTAQAWRPATAVERHRAAEDGHPALEPARRRLRVSSSVSPEKIIVPAPLSRFLPPRYLVLSEGLRAAGSARGR